jgi:hypothetical protein
MLEIDPRFTHGNILSGDPAIASLPMRPGLSRTFGVRYLLDVAPAPLIAHEQEVTRLVVASGTATSSAAPGYCRARDGRGARVACGRHANTRSTDPASGIPLRGHRALTLFIITVEVARTHWTISASDRPSILLKLGRLRTRPVRPCGA